MEPLIRNINDFPAGTPARLISADDNPSLVTLAYSVIEPGGTSAHHIHEWEHEVYIIEGSGTLVADGEEYPVKAGDAMFIPPMVDHVTRNDGDVKAWTAGDAPLGIRCMSCHADGMEVTDAKVTCPKCGASYARDGDFIDVLGQ